MVLTMFPSLLRSCPKWTRDWTAIVLFASLASAHVLPGGHLHPRPEPRAPSTSGNTYDYVIVGGGLTGLVAATRLTEDPDVNVLVLEYGIIDRSNATLVPFYATSLNTGAMFNITSAPEPFLNGNRAAVRAGSITGGGSSVNGMTFDLGSAGDYDSWEQLGNKGWGWKDLRPFFLKVCRNGTYCGYANSTRRRNSFRLLQTSSRNTTILSTPGRTAKAR